MQPRRLRCKIRAANFLTREPYFLVPVTQILLVGGLTLLSGVQLFDEGDAVYLVQGRNTAENLLQGRVSKARQPFRLRRSTHLRARPSLDNHFADIIR